MASRFNTIQQIPGYQGLPLDILLKAGMAKDANIQQGIDKNQEMIDTIGGIETYGAFDTQRKQIKLAELQSNIQKLGSSDFTNPNTQNQINSLIQGFSNDPEVSQWYIHAQNAKASNDFLNEQNKKGNYYDNNWKQYNDVENNYNSQDPTQGVSKSPLTTPYYGLDYQDIGKETRDIVNTVGIGTLQPLTFDPTTGSYYTVEGKPAQNITDAVYSQLSDKSKLQIANDFYASPELQKTFSDIGAYYTSIAKDAAISYSVPKMDFTSPKNSGTGNGTSGGNGTSTIPIAPYLRLVNDPNATITPKQGEGLLGVPMQADGSYNISLKDSGVPGLSGGTIMRFANTGTPEGQKENNQIQFGYELKNIESKHPLSTEDSHLISNLRNGSSVYKYKTKEGVELKTQKERDAYADKLYNASIAKQQQEISSDPNYQALLTEANKRGIDITNPKFKNEIENIDTDKLQAQQSLGAILKGLDHANFKLDVSNPNKLNVDDNMFLSGSVTLTEGELNNLFEPTGILSYFNNQIGDWGGGDWGDIYLEKGSPGEGLITPAGKDSKTGENLYSINIQKKVGIDQSIADSYDSANTQYNQTPATEVERQSQYHQYWQGNEINKQINTIKDTDSQKSAKDTWDEINSDTWDNNGKLYKPTQQEREDAINNFNQILLQEQKTPGTIKKLQETKPTTINTPSTINTSNIKGDTLAIRNNNPGNIRSVAGGFIKYDSMKEGLDGLKDYVQRALTGRHKSYNPNETLLEFSKTYSPKSDGNDPIAKANSIAKDLGVTPDTPIKDLGDKLDAFVQAIIKTEDVNLYNQLYN